VYFRYEHGVAAGCWAYVEEGETVVILVYLLRGDSTLDD
jgi:hypothetical protein